MPTTTKKRPEALKKIKAAARKHGLKLSAPLRNALLEVSGTADPTADICYNSGGDAEADPGLRDTELIPLPSDIPLPLPLGYDKRDSNDALIELVADHCETYLDREVRPHVGQAWIDTARPRSATKSPSTATSTCTSPRARWRRSRRT